MLSLIGLRGSSRLTELADELGLPLTTASDSARRLERRRLIRRRQNPDDGRSWLFELTAAGDREWRRGWNALQRIDARLEQELGDTAGIRDSLDELGRAFGAALTQS
jgi:DNA-binding MarR family transcriptional regulator